MLSIDEARARVLAAVVPLGSEEVAIGTARGRVLAEDVAAAHDVPPFANSAMDGFAVRAADGLAERTIVGESRAGAPAREAVGPGEAVRISTGAVLPAGADAVIPLERVEERAGGDVAADGDAPHVGAAGGRIVPTGAVRAGDHLRGAGDDLRAGEVVLRAGTRLGAAALGVAIGAGRGTVRVALVPRVAIVVTGDELVPPGAPLGPGQIHDANSIALAALAAGDGADVVAVTHARDEAEATEAALAAALDDADVVLVSGGVSVGPHDHVRPALEDLGVVEDFWRVALRPGKPTWFGTRGPTLVFGLPGNPVSSLVTYVLFARPALAALQGAPAAQRASAILGEAVPRQEHRDEAVRVRFAEDGRVHATGPQASHVASSMLGAQALAIVPRGTGELAAGTRVAIEPL